jgi:hypothetical protein
MKKEQKIEEITALFETTSYLKEYLDYEYLLEDAIDGQDISVFENGIDDLFNDYLIVYYNNAMPFLMEEDPSLEEALEYADELGFSIRDLDSEKLANLLLEKRIREEWEEIKSDVEDVLMEDTDDEEDEE